MGKEEVEPEESSSVVSQPEAQKVGMENNIPPNNPPKSAETVDIENNIPPNNPPNSAAENHISNFSIVLQQLKRENLLEKCCILLRALCCLFSFISFVIMASDKQGDGSNFDDHQEYQYLLAVAIMAFVYSMAQVAYQAYRFTTEKFLIPKRAMGIMHYAGDQVIAYLLMSALSAAIPITNQTREESDNLFADLAAASISMAFFAFSSIGLSALISGYKLSTETYI